MDMSNRVMWDYHHRYLKERLHDPPLGKFHMVHLLIGSNIADMPWPKFCQKLEQFGDFYTDCGNKFFYLCLLALLYQGRKGQALEDPAYDAMFTKYMPPNVLSLLATLGKVVRDYPKLAALNISVADYARIKPAILVLLMPAAWKTAKLPCLTYWHYVDSEDFTDTRAYGEAKRQHQQLKAELRASMKQKLRIKLRSLVEKELEEGRNVKPLFRGLLKRAALELVAEREGLQLPAQEASREDQYMSMKVNFG